jgi:hypothetical protein
MSQIRKIRYRLFAWHHFPELKPAQEPIDVVIPLVAKDLRIFPLCLEGIRHCVPHPIKDIYIVAPPQDEVIQFCQENGLVFVDESTVFGFNPKEIGLKITWSDGSVSDRSGWFFQQLLKLSGNVGTCRYYLCIDADHVLIRPHVFLTEDRKTVFYLTYEYHQPIIDHLHRFLPELELDNLSYVDHKMLFDKEQLKMLHEVITKQTGKPWLEAAIESYDRSLSTPSAFSEFEIYGNFVKDKVRRPWLQKRLPYSKIADYETLCRRWAGSRWSLTFPEYMNKK